MGVPPCNGSAHNRVLSEESKTPAARKDDCSWGTYPCALVCKRRHERTHVCKCKHNKRRPQGCACRGWALRFSLAVCSCSLCELMSSGGDGGRTSVPGGWGREKRENETISTRIKMLEKAHRCLKSVDKAGFAAWCNANISIISQGSLEKSSLLSNALGIKIGENDDCPPDSTEQGPRSHPFICIPK